MNVQPRRKCSFSVDTIPTTDKTSVMRPASFFLTLISYSVVCSFWKGLARDNRTQFRVIQKIFAQSPLSIEPPWYNTRCNYLRSRFSRELQCAWMEYCNWSQISQKFHQTDVEREWFSFLVMIDCWQLTEIILNDVPVMGSFVIDSFFLFSSRCIYTLRMSLFRIHTRTMYQTTNEQ